MSRVLGDDHCKRMPRVTKDNMCCSLRKPSVSCTGTVHGDVSIWVEKISNPKQTNRQTMNNVTFTEYFMNCVIVPLLFVKHVRLSTQKARTIKCLVNCFNLSTYISFKHFRFFVNITIKYGKEIDIGLGYKYLLKVGFL